MVSTEPNDIQVVVIVTATEELGHRWILLVERDDGHAGRCLAVTLMLAKIR